MTTDTIQINPSEDRINDVLAHLDLIGEDGEPTDAELYEALYLALESEEIEVEMYYSPAEKPSGEWGYSLGYPGCDAEAEVCGAKWFGQEIELNREETERAEEATFEAVENARNDRDYDDYRDDCCY